MATQVPTPTVVCRTVCVCVWVSELTGHDRHRKPRHKLLLPERQRAETLSLELRLFDLHGGFPGLWLLCGSMNSRGLPDHLPPGTPRSSSTTLRVHRQHLLPNDPRQRPRLLLRHCGTYTYNHVERLGPGHHQRQELITDSSDTAVRENSNGTPDGSTLTNANRYTAVRVLSFATPPHRVLFISNPAFSNTSPTTSVIDNPYIHNPSNGNRVHLPLTPDAPE